MSETLTQEELSALERESVSSGYEMKTEEVLRRDAVDYDLLSVENAVAGVIPTIETIMERLGNRFRARLSEDLRKDVDISVSPVDIGAYAEVVGDNEKQCEVSVFEVEPLQGRMLLVVERKLTFSLVDAYFGGSGASHIERLRTDYTATELRMNMRIRRHVVSSMEAAWKPFCTINTREVARETNAKHLAQFDTSEQYVVGSMKIRVGEADGLVRIAYESVAFEPIRTRMRRREGVRRKNNQHSLKHLHRLGLEDTDLDLAVVLGEKVFSMREMLGLRKGDFIPLDIKELGIVRCEDVDLFVGKVGDADGWNALELTGFGGVDLASEAGSREKFRSETGGAKS
jgi:flagellar motor switch protein FliM